MMPLSIDGTKHALLQHFRASWFDIRLLVLLALQGSDVLLIIPIQILPGHQ